MQLWKAGFDGIAVYPHALPRDSINILYSTHASTPKHKRDQFHLHPMPAQQVSEKKKETLLGFDGLGSLNGQFLSSTGSLVFGKQADLCQVRWALDNKFLRVNRFTISPEDNLMSL